ncbi:MAG: alpha-L-fucosidase [Prolixibacteraceae bacterium]
MDGVELFRESGAKYVVLTSKHHEGFALWPSKLSWNWNAVDVGPHRDLLGDLTTAVRKAGLKMGYYYSLLEWFHPLYQKGTIEKYVDDHMIPQMKELVTAYRPDIFWTDGEWDYPSDVLKSTSFLQWLYNESPVKDQVVVNDRWGKETRSLHGGFYTTEYDLVHTGNASAVKFERPWEECRGIGGSFGYNRNENFEDYASSEELVHILINKVGRGGNLLLNIGPTADGRIPVIMQQRLMDMGAWLKVNGEAIYNTRTWKDAPAVTPETTIYYTNKAGTRFFVLSGCTKTPDYSNVYF